VADLNERLQQHWADDERLRASYLQRLRLPQGTSPEAVDEAIAQLIESDQEIMRRTWADAVEASRLES